MATTTTTNNNSQTLADDFEEVPVVDLSHFYDASLRDTFVRQLGEAIQSCGFVRVVNHDVPQELVEQVYSVGRKFFALPEEVKAKYHCKYGNGNRGWAPFGMEHAKDNAGSPDLKEFFHVGRELLEDHQFFNIYGPNLFPTEEEVPEFRTKSLALFNALDRAARTILSALALYCGVDATFFDDIVADGNSILRIIHYPPISDKFPVNSIRASAHEDINLITILPSATTSGLEILRKSDQKWIPCKDKVGELVVDTGDMMARLTNGFFPATTHRVSNPSDETEARKERMSIPFFTHPNPTAVLDAHRLPERVWKYSGKQPEEPITAHDFLMKRLREIGLI
eukprot:GEZU01028246.1.p1 GENE.GEZU01028246.1~~GEZU01028246.1.p1  ORF type:complete len:358 (+),score=103.92 GEZU01028246.1:60-1076(+)